jgi:hypothetical protein
MRSNGTGRARWRGVVHRHGGGAGQRADGGCAEFGDYVSGTAKSSGGPGTVVSGLGTSGPGVVADAVEGRQDATCATAP